MRIAPTARSPFVGRIDELVAIEGFVASAFREPSARAVFVFGPPGAGKTRLVAEVIADLERERVVPVTGYEPEADVPFASVSTLVRELPGSVVGRDHLRVFETVDRRLCDRGASLIAVEDLQWVDAASRALLHYLLRGASARRSPLAVVATSRGDPECRTFAASTRNVLGHDNHLEMELGPLDFDGACAMVAALRPELGARDAERLYRRSGGWPFWIDLLCKADAEVDEAINRWLSQVGADATRTLDLLAVAERALTTDAIAQLLGWSGARVVAALAETERRGLTLAVGGAARISHELLRDAIERRVSQHEAALAHRRVAEHLESVAGSDVQTLLDAVRHRMATGSPTLSVVRRILETPGRRGVGSRGVDRLWTLATSADAEHAEITPVLIELAALASELGEPGEAASRWVAVAGRLCDGPARARAWLEASMAALLSEDVLAARAFLTRARAVPSPDETLCVHLDAHEASVLFLERRLTEGASLAGQALRRARALSATRDSRSSTTPEDRAAYVRALAAAGEAARLTGDPSAMAEVGDEMVNVAATWDEAAHLEGLRLAGFGLLMLGRSSEAEAHLRAGWDLARARALPTAMLDGGFWLALALHAWGRLEDAGAVVEQCLALGQKIGAWSRSLENVEVQARRLEVSVGDWRVALDGLRERVDQEQDPHARIRACFWLVSDLARLSPQASAAEVLRRLAQAQDDADAAACRRCGDELNLRAADALARTGAIHDATSCCERFCTGRMPDDAYLSWWHTRAQATIAAASEAASASEQLEAVTRAADGLGFELEAVWTRLDLAAFSSDDSQAISWLEDARRRANRLGARTEERVAEQRLRSHGVRVWRRGADGAESGGMDALTERETEIARLAAEGSTNPEIAELLFVSRKTVESHLSHIFTKLGIRNRTELAMRLSEEGVRS